VNASDAREELEAVLWKAGMGFGVMDAALEAADRYREAAPDGDGRTVHLEGTAGAQTACRFRWQDPSLLSLTGNPAAASCRRCRRSRRYKDLTGGGDGG
jgi:hypothetical protein